VPGEYRVEPDVAIHVGTIATAVLLALRSDRAACAIAGGAAAGQGAGDGARSTPGMAHAGA